MGKRIDYFDMLRGVAIVFVIINHSYSGNPLNGGFKDELYLLVRQITTCAVPIFLAESGYFLANKHISGKIDYFQFLGSHSFRVWFPMVLWSLPLFFIQDHNNIVLSFVFLLAGGYSIYYFITLIIQYYALQPLLAKINLGGVIFSLLITASFVMADMYVIAIKGNHIPLLFECGPFVMWIAYPAIGYYLGKNGRNYKIAIWLVLMVLSLLACMIESKWLYSFHGEGLGVTKLSSLCFSLCAILVLFSENTQHFFNPYNWIYKTIVYVGEVSFGIYLIHKYFLDFLIEPFVEDTLLRAFLTLLSSIALIAIVKKIIPLGLSRTIGFR